MSMTTNKQAPVQRYANYGVDMMEWAEGGYVKYDAYQSLLDDLEAAEKRISELEVKPVTLVLPHDSEVELVADRCNRHRKAKQAAGITTKGE